jgi:hypothetical protein
MVCRSYGVFVMFNHNHRITQVAQAHQVS